MAAFKNENSLLSKSWKLLFPWLHQGAPNNSAHQQAITSLELVNAPVILRPARVSDYADWYKLRLESRDHLTKWEPDWEEQEATHSAFTRRIKADIVQMRARRRYSFLMLEENEGTLVGGISLSDIRYGNRRSGILGYWIGERFARNGMTSAGIEAIQNFAFHTLELNRIEAACQPGNIASRNLLQKTGFEQEGLARDYLNINGAWRDHEIWAFRGRAASPKN